MSERQSRLDFMLITAAPDIARHAERCGVRRVFVDMETIGKAARQGHLDTHQAAHTLADVAAVAAALDDAELMVRLNPPGPWLPDEVAGALAAGAGRLMLPMFGAPAEVRDFLAAVAGRAPVTLLVETPAALSSIERWLPLLGPADEVHFGLNDLALGLGCRFVFEPLADGHLELPAACCRTTGLRFGIGGVARIGAGELPAEWVLGEHVRLGSSWVILSRAFRGQAADLATLERELDLAAELARLRAVEASYRAAGPDALAANRARLAARVAQIAGRERIHG